jgi:hypothetical protein
LILLDQLRDDPFVSNEVPESNPKCPKNTFPVNGGAMPVLTVSNLIDETTGETNIVVLKGLARRRALAEYGAISPRSLRSALRHYSDALAQMQTAWRERHGLPVEYVMVTSYGTPLA